MFTYRYRCCACVVCQSVRNRLDVWPMMYLFRRRYFHKNFNTLLTPVEVELKKRYFIKRTRNFCAIFHALRLTLYIFNWLQIKKGAISLTESFCCLMLFLRYFFSIKYNNMVLLNNNSSYNKAHMRFPKLTWPPAAGDKCLPMYTTCQFRNELSTSFDYIVKVNNLTQNK